MNDDQQPQQEQPENPVNPWSEAPEPQMIDSNQSSYAAPATEEPVAMPTVVPPVSAATGPVVGQPVAPGVPPVVNPGQTLGIVSIVLGVLSLWVIGLPLAIVSMVKSSKAHASKVLGIVGLVLNIIAIFVSAFIIFVIFLSIPALQKASEEANAKTTSLSIAAGGTIPLTVDYTPAHANVSFTVPTGYLGWTVTSVEKDGVNEFTKDDASATFMTYHGTLSGRTGTDKEVTQQAMADYITQLDAIEVSNSESTVSFATTSDGKMLQFETKQITSESDGKPIKGIVAVRMYEGHELSVIYLANADSFSLDDWDSLTSQVKLNDEAS